MATLSRSTFAAGDAIIASDMNTNFTNVETLINQVLSGNEAFNGLTDSGAASFASLTATGTVTAGAFSTTGAITAASGFTGEVTATPLTATGDANFDSGTLFVDASTNRVGIKDTTPDYELDVAGEIRATGNVRGNQFMIGSSDDGLKSVTGDYGSVETAGSGKNGWEGYSISGHAVFMSAGSSGTFGLYDDANSKWGIACDRLGGTNLYYNGSMKLNTKSAGVDVTGTLDATGNVTADGHMYVGSNGGGDSAIHFYDDTANTWRSLRWSNGNDWRIEHTNGSNYKLWHAGNDGSGSGLDADTLDGQHASAFLGATAKAADSEKLDGINSLQFLRSDQDDTMVGALVIDDDASVSNAHSLRVIGNHGNSAAIDWSSASVVIDDTGSYPSLSFRSAYTNHSVVLRLSTATTNKLLLRNLFDNGWANLEIGSLTQSSDLSLKTKTGDVPGLDLVSELSPFKGYWNDGDQSEVHFWLGAQEVCAALTAAGLDSDACTVVDDGEDSMGLQYTQLIPVLVKAVQELTTRLEAVEAA